MQWGFCFNGFWSSVTLTGNETVLADELVFHRFWSSVTLTGNEAGHVIDDIKKEALG